MSDHRPPTRPAAAGAAPAHSAGSGHPPSMGPTGAGGHTHLPDGDALLPQLRALGARAHQLRAAARAADHYTARDDTADRDTGSWLMSCAAAQAAELAMELDNLARSLKERGTDATAAQKLAPMRVLAHQLHAASKAADHFLDQEGRDNLDTGSWLIATTRGLAERLAAALDDNVVGLRRAA